MAYQALYRQWRLTRFASFVGQEAVVTTLRNQVASGRVAHAYLFCGSRGTGKTSAARIMARAINCLQPQEGEPCGVCAVCERLAGDDTLDVVEIDAASNNGVDEIRDLREKVKYPPQVGRFRVYIIDEVHMLSTGAFNALLKTLEEPPAHAVFILATTEPQKLPATILSRCQRYDFHRIPLRAMVGRLREAVQRAGVAADEAALERIARAAEGGMRDAYSILDMCLSYGGDALDEARVLALLGASDRAFLFRFAQALAQEDAAAALWAIDEMHRQGRDAQVFARDVTGHLRALLLAKSCGDVLADLLETTHEDAQAYRAQAEQFSSERLLRVLDIFLGAENDMKWASQPRIALEMAGARACMPERGKSEEALARRVEQLERALQEGAALAPRAQASVPAPAPAAQTAQPPAEPPADAPPWALEQADTAQIVTAENIWQEPPEERDMSAEAQPVEPPMPAVAQPAAEPAKAAPQPAAQPERAEAAAQGDDPQALWKRMMDNLKKSEPACYAQIRRGRFVGVQGTVYRVLFAEIDRVYAQTLATAFWKNAIERVLQEAGAKDATLACEMEDAAPSRSETDAAAHRQQQVFAAFGRQNVQLVDDEA